MMTIILAKEITSIQIKKIFVYDNVQSFVPMKRLNPHQEVTFGINDAPVGKLNQVQKERATVLGGLQQF